MPFARNAARRFPLRRFLLPASGVLALAACLSAGAEESLTAEIRVAATQGREVAVMPSARSTGKARTASGWINGQSHETGSQRVHVVYFEGRTYRASTPLRGPASRIAFDPSRRKFARLLPSIRVEIDNAQQLESAKQALGASKADYFEKLGFAILHLPDELHPVEAMERLRKVPGRPRGSIRLPRPPIRWR